MYDLNLIHHTYPSNKERKFSSKSTLMTTPRVHSLQARVLFIKNGGFSKIYVQLYPQPIIGTIPKSHESWQVCSNIHFCELTWSLLQLWELQNWIELVRIGTITMTKKEVLVGCNYPGARAELKGCMNNVKRMYKFLIECYVFEEENIRVIIDTDDSYPQPTGANVRRALKTLAGGARAGDIIFFHYSGHGTRLPTKTWDQEHSRYDECMVPYDMNLLVPRSH